MKKFTLALITFLVGLLSQAQTEQGKLFIGGNIGLYNQSYQGNKDWKVNRVSFSPNTGYFIANRLALGLELGISTAKNTYLAGVTDGIPTLTTRKSNDFSITPFIKYFIPAGNDQFFFSPSFGASILFNKIKSSSSDNSSYSSSEKDYAIFISPGFTFFPSSHWGISLNVGDLSYKISNPEGDKNNTSTFNFNLASGSSIGVSYFF